MVQVKRKILEVLKDNKTHKIVEVAYELGVEVDDILEDLLELDTLGFIEVGGYLSDPSVLKFVRMRPVLYEKV